MRVDGKFVDANGEKAEGQYVSAGWVREGQTDRQALLFLLRRSHGLIYRLISESEPISEELMPIVSILHSDPLASDASGKQAFDNQKMFERGAQVWRTIYAPGLVPISPRPAPNRYSAERRQVQRGRRKYTRGTSYLERPAERGARVIRNAQRDHVG